jgi:predicted Zn-dependent peptidase
MNKAKLDEEIDFLGGNIGTSATSASASSLKNNFPKVIALMSDVVLRPSFPAIELEKIRKQELSGLQAAKDNPDAIADNVVNRLMYGKDHPYGDIETEETISNVKLDDIKNYFATYWKPNNAFLVFVGDITAAEAKTLATQAFGTWKAGVVPKLTYKTPQAPQKTYIALVDRPASVQSIINFAMPVELKQGAPDVIPSSVMSNILGGGFSGRLFANLREKHGFTYGAYSNLKADRLIGAFTADASVRNEKTDSAIAQFLNEFNRIRTETVDANEISRMKNFLSGSFARSLENPSTIANFALNTARYNLPANYYQDYLKNLASTTPQMVQTMSGKYVRPGNMLIVIVGNAKEIAPGLEKYGEVKYFNSYGKEIEAPTVKKVDASVTPQSIFQKAIAAYGGETAIAAIKDVQLTGTTSIQGMDLTITKKHILPSTYSFEMGMKGMVLQKMLLKDGKYTQSGQGGAKEVDDKDKEEMNEHASLFLEPYLLKQKGYEYTIKGIEKVDGKDAYAVAIKTPAKREFTNYYDVASGLRVKQTTTQDGPAGQMTINTTISDYKLFNGVQIPTRLGMDLGMMKFDVKFNDVKVNTGLRAEDIK